MGVNIGSSVRGVLAWKLGTPASVMWGKGWPSSLTHRCPVPAFVWAICKMLDQIFSKASPSYPSPLETQSQFTSVVSAVGLKGGWGTMSWGLLEPKEWMPIPLWPRPACVQSRWRRPLCPGVWGFSGSQLPGSRISPGVLAMVSFRAWVMEGVFHSHSHSHSVGSSLTGNTSLRLEPMSPSGEASRGE